MKICLVGAELLLVDGRIDTDRHEYYSHFSQFCELAYGHDRNVRVNVIFLSLFSPSLQTVRNNSLLCYTDEISFPPPPKRDVCYMLSYVIFSVIFLFQTDDGPLN
jgi:hypothetical protein